VFRAGAATELARAALDEIEAIRQEQLAHVRKLCRLDEPDDSILEGK
jgi:hypothetical protein